MPLAVPLPLLADVGEYITLAILVLSFLGWIVNAIKGNQADGQPRPVKPQPQRDLRAELEVFLEELQGGKPQPKPAPKPQPERPRPQPAVNQSKKKSRDKKPQAKPAPKTLVQPSVTPSAIGGGVREHVAAYMTPDHVGAHAQAHIGAHRIDDAVARDLAGGTVAAIAPVATPKHLPHPLLIALSSRDGLRQAVILQDILQKPRALRRDA